MAANMKIIKNEGEIVEVNKNLYEILKKLPAPDKNFIMTKTQKHWWNYYGQQLVDAKKLTKTDLIHLFRLAKSIDYYIQAENEIAKRDFIGGLVQVFKTGATNITGFVSIRDNALSDIDKISKHFGFSFKDRKALKEGEAPSAQLDLFELEQKLKAGGY